MEWGGVFNVARYLTDSLRGPVLQTLRRARSAIWWDGLDGLDGWDGNLKFPLTFIILRYIKHYIPLLNLKMEHISLTSVI